MRVVEAKTMEEIVEREIIWSGWERPGLEHLRLVASDRSISADSVVIGLEEDRPFRIHYEIRCDASWRVREMRVSVPGSERPSLDLLADGEGRWTTRGGEILSELEGCVDVDISATPFTNTLPIRRLELAPEESTNLNVAFVHVPELRVSREKQRYACLQERADGDLYRFEALPSGFTAELPVDGDGLVIDYPGLFRRAWSY